VQLAEREEILSNNFTTKNEFSQHIETIAALEDISIIEAITDYCKKNNLEIEAVPALLSPSLVKKIQLQSSELNLMKPKYKTNGAKL